VNPKKTKIRNKKPCSIKIGGIKMGLSFHYSGSIANPDSLPELNFIAIQLKLEAIHQPFNNIFSFSR
jgi:hypothetical protein